MGELVLHDAAGEFLLVHGSDEYLSLARRATASGEIPLVRFAPQHSPIVAAALEVVLSDPDGGPLSVQAGSDDLRVETVRRAGGRRVRVANLSRRRAGSMDPEALELDRQVVAETVEALRGPRLAPLCEPRRSSVFEDDLGRAAGVESAGGVTTVSARTERVWARASFSSSLRRVVAACLATVVGNPAESSIRVAYVERQSDAVLVERLATSLGAFPYQLANARRGRLARPRRAARPTTEMAAWVGRSLARDDDPPPALAAP